MKITLHSVFSPIHAILTCLLLLVSHALAAQSIVTISPLQCVWHAGDNSRWATPDLDETGRQPYTAWHIEGGNPYLWIRCHADLTSLAGLAHPALQFENGRAFQAFLNGEPLGRSGDVEGGWYTNNVAPVFPLRGTRNANEPAVIALRIAYRSDEQGTPVRINAGDQQVLQDRHDGAALHRSHLFLPVEICYVAIGFAGFLLLAMYLNDRCRLELLLLAIYCLCQLINRMTEYIDIAAIQAPWALISAFFVVGQCLFFAEIWFIFRLAGKRIPWLLRILVLLSFLYPLQILLSLVLPLHLSLRVSAAYFSVSSEQIALDSLAVLIAPLVAFWPWNRIRKGLRSLAVCCLLWAVIDGIWLAFAVPSTTEESAMAQQWAYPLLLVRAFAALGVISTLVALLLRDQRRTAEERALLAGEMQAAQEIQQMLVQPGIEAIPGLRIEVVFRPIREVGGDFYLCRVLPGDRQRILIGDVSGKGAAAAMTAALLIGAAGRRPADSPAQLLHHLNIVLADTRFGGFAICFCADIAHDGAATLANAGHLAPYRNGDEYKSDSGLPLGLTGDADYSEFTVQLALGDTLTFLSDGVVEAQNTAGELFGFDRARAISTQSAEQIAAAAQAHGQSDDITVLTVTLAPTEAPHV